MQRQLNIQTFGNFIIERDGEVYQDFLTIKAAVLITYLALYPEAHPRSKLATLLWSDTAHAQALKNLRTVLSSLRDDFHDMMIISRDTLAIRDDVMLSVDANIFKTDYHRVVSMPHSEKSLVKLQEIADLYKGDFLADTQIRNSELFNDWLDTTRQILSQLYIQLLSEICKRALDNQDYALGLPYAQLLVSLDPYWEVAQRQLMRLYVGMQHINEALIQYEKLALLLEQELETTPDEETTALYLGIKSGDSQFLSASPTQQLDLSDTPFVEPTEDMELAYRMLSTPQCRLLTIVGISGIGKTTFASQLAMKCQQNYQDGVYIVPISTADSAQNLASLIAQKLKLSLIHDGDTSIDKQVIAHLQSKNMLLVLDNYEHIFPQTNLLLQIMDNTSNIQVVINSHTQLNLFREWLLPLRGLSIQNDDVQIETSEAVRLFEMTAQRVQAQFSLAESLDTVIKICRLMDGLPLGIVIAAGWCQYMSPQDILALIEQDLLQLESTHQDIPSRHRSFRNLVQSMLHHISADEQEILLSLSVFNGSFSQQAALAIADINILSLKHLTDKCLIQRTGQFRYVLHNIVRTAFKTQLKQSGVLGDILGRYVQFFKGWSDSLFEQNLPLHELLDVVDAEEHNLWAIEGLSDTETQAFILHIAPTLRAYWINRGYHLRGLLDLLEKSTHNSDFPLYDRVRGMIELARILHRTSQYERAWAICQTILQAEVTLENYEMAHVYRLLSEICVSKAMLSEARVYLEDIIKMEAQHLVNITPQMSLMVCYAYQDLGEIFMSEGNYEDARHFLQIAMMRWEKMGEVLHVSVIRSYLGIIALKEEHYQKALIIFDAILNDAQQANNDTLTAIYMSYLAISNMKLGQYPSAYAQYQDALAIALKIDRKTTLINVLENISRLASHLDNFEIAIQLMGFSNTLRTQINLPVTPHNQADYDTHITCLAEKSPEKFEHHYQWGQHMGLMTALELVNLLGKSLA